MRESTYNVSNLDRSDINMNDNYQNADQETIEATSVLERTGLTA